ncbi:hypothetical protein ACMV5L_06185 [Serratia plymuthica]|uniref:hypothetical protein n=1 Tax=Serratia plymuthica TaxID=82996 RepID=UPI003DA42A8D
MNRIQALVEDKQFLTMAGSLTAMAAADEIDGAKFLFAALALGFVLVVRHSR